MIKHVVSTTDWSSDQLRDRDPLLSSVDNISDEEDEGKTTDDEDETMPLDDAALLKDAKNPNTYDTGAGGGGNDSNSMLVPSDSSTKAGAKAVRRRLALLTSLSALGGFLFGYDTGVISGALLLLNDHFSLTTTQSEAVVTSTIVACFVSSMCAPYALRWGRRPVLLAASAVFTTGSLMLAYSPTYEVLLAARLVIGGGVGAASLTVPLYLAELSPKELRGKVVTANTLCVAFGQFSAGMVDGLFTDVHEGWRWMLGLGAVPGFVMFVGFLGLPER